MPSVGAPVLPRSKRTSVLSLHKSVEYIRKDIVREEILLEQIADVLQKVSLPPLWADNVLAKVESEREQDTQNSVALAQNLKREIEDLDKRWISCLIRTWTDLFRKWVCREKAENPQSQNYVSEKLKDFEQGQSSARTGTTFYFRQQTSRNYRFRREILSTRKFSPEYNRTPSSRKGLCISLPKNLGKSF